MPFDARHGVSFDPETRLLVHGDKECRLQRGPLRFCVYLMQTPGVVRTREQILDALHGEGFDIFNRSVDGYAKRARLQILPEFGFDPIKTSYCVGYYWDDGAAPKIAEPRPDTEVWCDQDRRLVMRGERYCELTNMQFQICSMLSARPGVIRSRAFFIDALHHNWPPASERVIDSLVQRARRKMQRDLGVDQIKTSYGDGYYWLKPTDAAPQPSRIRFTVAT